MSDQNVTSSLVNKTPAAVYVRTESEVEAMPWRTRLRKRINTLMNNKSSYSGKDEEISPIGGDTIASQQQQNQNDDTGNNIIGSSDGNARPNNSVSKSFSYLLQFVEENEDKNSDYPDQNRKSVQYRFEPPDEILDQTFLRQILTLNGLIKTAPKRKPTKTKTTTSKNNSWSFFARSSSLSKATISYYLHVMFRADFLSLFIGMCCAFFGITFLFSCLIAIAGVVDPQCIVVGGDSFDSDSSRFADAFALSWTTFSTVGYGTSYPALGFQNNNWANCFVANVLCALESLIGVLYAGFCGAILFGKVLRIQSDAQVIFSDPIVIRYGKLGLCNDDDDIDDENDDGDAAVFPLLEFRIINRLFKQPGAEIMDASLTVVANVDESDGKYGVPSDSIRESQLTPVSSTGSLSNQDQNNQFDTESKPPARGFFGSEVGKSFRSLGSKRKTSTISSTENYSNIAVDDDPSARIVTRHIFTRMELEASDHPFFKRVWCVRHVLDEKSPLLSPIVRRQIRKNNGLWPEKLNTFDDIRESLNFNQILVTLNGVSNISASSVYAQKIYDYVDLHIGYEFVNVLYRESDETLGVDINLINDIREQNGGGGEPLVCEGDNPEQ